MGGSDGRERQGVLARGEGGGRAIHQAGASLLERTARQDHQYQGSLRLMSMLTLNEKRIRYTNTALQGGAGVRGLGLVD